MDHHIPSPSFGYAVVVNGEVVSRHLHSQRAISEARLHGGDVRHARRDGSLASEHKAPPVGAALERLICDRVQDLIEECMAKDAQQEMILLDQVSKQVLYELMIRAEEPWEGVMAAQRLLCELSKLIAARTAELVEAEQAT